MAIHELRTDRLRLRHYVKEDAEARVQQFHARRPDHSDRDWLAYHVCLYDASGDLGCLAVTLREGGSLIGDIGLEPDAPPILDFELSYRFGEDFRSKGDATEACQAA